MITPVTPSVTAWPTASAITFGQALSASTLSGGSATVAGSFAFTAPSTVPGAVGTYSAAVTFTPTDTTNYTSVSGNVNVTVNAASASVILSNLTQAYTGSPLYPTATTSPAGLAITWANAPQTNAGSYSVTATINDSATRGRRRGPS